MLKNGFAQGKVSEKIKDIEDKYKKLNLKQVKLAGKKIEIELKSVKRTGPNISSLMVREVGKKELLPLSSTLIETDDPVLLTLIAQNI